MTPAEAIDSISAGLTGTGLTVLGWLLARSGIVRGIGGGDEGSGGIINIYGGKVTARGGQDGAGIGGTDGAACLFAIRETER